MNNTINQVAATEQVQTSRQRQTAKSDDGRFQSMLSDALKGKAKTQDTVNTTESTTETAEKPAQTESKPVKGESEAAAQTQAKPQKTSENADEDDKDAGCEQNAVIAAMQLVPQIQVPVQMPQEQEETNTTAVEAAAPLVQAAEAHTAGTARTAFEAVQAPDAEPQGIPKADTDIAQEYAEALTQADISTQAQAPAQIMEQTVATGETVPRTERPDRRRIEASSTPKVEKNRHVETAQAAARPEQEAKIPEEAQVDISDVRVGRKPQPLSQMQIGARQVQTDGKAQSKFDEMLTRATQELNPEKETVAEQKTVQLGITEAAIPEEAETSEQPVKLKVNADVAAERQEVPEARTESQATVQRSEKAPITVRRPQKEISKTDETALGIVQPKEPVYTNEVVRQEPISAANPVQVPEQAEQVKIQLIQNLENEKMEFQMQLKPQELGKVDVRMVLESGRLSVEIAAANPKSAEMLSRQAEGLVATLKASGIDVSSVNVVTANESASADMNSEFNLNNFRNQAGEQERRPQSASTGHGRGQNSENGQKERETRETPQRILNYAI